MQDRELGADCVAHARMFFNRPAFDLTTATSPTFSIIPEGKMSDDLRRDYHAMSGMIFSGAPTFDAIVADISELETTLNAWPDEEFSEADSQEHG